MPGQHRPELNVTQLIAGAGATVTATVAASYFGVGGTLIGAGAVSVLSTVGATVYQHFLERGKAQIVAKIPARTGTGTGEARGKAREGNGAPAGPPSGRPWPQWYVVLGAAAGIFLAVMGLVTAFELFTGKPLSSTVRGGTGQGTSVHPLLGPAPRAPAPPASDEASPLVTVTASNSAAPEPTPHTTPTPSSSTSAQPVPGQRSSESTADPALVPAPATRSSLPQQPLDDQDDWHTP
jgi:hypothetical protein